MLYVCRAFKKFLFNGFFALFKEPVSFFGIFVSFWVFCGGAVVWAFLKAI